MRVEHVLFQKKSARDGVEAVKFYGRTVAREHRDDHALFVFFILPKDHTLFYGLGTKEFAEIQMCLFCIIFIGE